MFSKITIGGKLYTSFGVFLFLSIALGISSIYCVRNIAELLDVSVNQTARKIKLAGEVDAASTKMVAADRGILIRSAIKDYAEARQYEEQYQTDSTSLLKTLDELSPLLVMQESRNLVAEIRDQNAQMKDVDTQVYTIATGGNLEGAVKLQREKLVPIQQQMQDSSQKLVKIQDDILAEAVTNVAQVKSASIWTVVTVLLFAAMSGLAGIVVVRQTNRSLRRSVVQLDDASQQIASAATQVASTSQSMAQGSSEQAATIEETSASSSEINSMAQRNTENSRVTAEIVARSQQGFEQTNRSLEEMVEAMQQITSSSHKISQIIKVIDTIAFQTNILALNAAVEAARAGDAGMGFAVVADEVRALAQRCAAAASDTSGLIEESMLSAASGKAKVDQVAESIHTITAESMKMKSLIDEISLGSMEQARGIDQISKSISQMEVVTQSSAANAEESAAAAEELDAQARTMHDIVVELNSMVNGYSSRSIRSQHHDGRLEQGVFQTANAA